MLVSTNGGKQAQKLTQAALTGCAQTSIHPSIQCVLLIVAYLTRCSRQQGANCRHAVLNEFAQFPKISPTVTFRGCHDNRELIICKQMCAVLWVVGKC